MLKAALLSVIIPVYNVEPYLEQCLDSVVNQTYKNLEIICINDGSTDNSLKILEKYQKKDERIKLINQKNKGLSEARNAGLDVATGEYIAFVDSDDYLELNAYEEAMKVMLADRSVDLVEFNVRSFTNENSQILVRNVEYVNQQQVLNFKLKKHAGYVWNKIYKHSIINKQRVRFIPNLIHEDTFFSIAYIISCNQKYFLDKKLYNYRKRHNSILGYQRVSGGNKKFDLYKNLDALIAYAKCNNLYDQKKEYIFNEYVDRICVFCQSFRLLQFAIDHWDKKILDSDCPDKLKVKYLKKRYFIKSLMQRRGHRCLH